MTLAEASAAKLDAVCRKLELGPDDHVLEIGTGWGGFALHAAGRYGCRVTTTTISPEPVRPRARARARGRARGPRHDAARGLPRPRRARYDKLVSIEMIEAIGHQYFGEFFRHCAARLAPGGRDAAAVDHDRRPALRAGARRGRLHQALHLPRLLHPVGERARTGHGGIERPAHRAPRGHRAALRDDAARWRENFLATLGDVRALGYPESFIRMWEFYLCYCEAGFAERALGDVQMVLARD